MTALTYVQLGFPFFKMYEEPPGIFGNFGAVKSVAEIEKSKEGAIIPTRIVPISPSLGLENPNGPLREFRTAKELVKKYGGYHVVKF
jgi:hypothetical protein